MPQNKGNGGKSRKKGTNKVLDEKRELRYKQDGEEYAQVTRMLGNGRCEAVCIDNTTRQCHIRGTMHKKDWVATGDIILVTLRDYQDHKADVVHRYQSAEARKLKEFGELPEHVRLNEGVAGDAGSSDEDGASEYLQFQDEDTDISPRNI